MWSLSQTVMETVMADAPFCWGRPAGWWLAARGVSLLHTLLHRPGHGGLHWWGLTQMMLMSHGCLCLCVPSWPFLDSPLHCDFYNDHSTFTITIMQCYDLEDQFKQKSWNLGPPTLSHTIIFSVSFPWPILMKFSEVLQSWLTVLVIHWCPYPLPVMMWRLSVTTIHALVQLEMLCHCHPSQGVGSACDVCPLVYHDVSPPFS